MVRRPPCPLLFAAPTPHASPTRRTTPNNIATRPPASPSSPSNPSPPTTTPTPRKRVRVPPVPPRIPTTRRTSAPPRASVIGIDAAIAAGTLSSLPRLIERDLHTISYAVVLRVTTALLDAALWPSVLSVFDIVVAHQPLRIRFTHRIYTDLFYALMKLGRYSHALRAYTEWSSIVSEARDADLLGPRSYNFIYVLLSRTGLVDEALDVRNNCIANGYYLNRYSYNAFLNACAKSYRIADAFETLREMAESNVSPDVVSFNVLISCCVRSGDLDIALGILHRMKDWGISPDVYSYNSVINGLRKNRMLDEAFELVAQMEADAQDALGQALPLITDVLGRLTATSSDSAVPSHSSAEQRGKGLEMQRSSSLINALSAARRKNHLGRTHGTLSREGNPVINNSSREQELGSNGETSCTAASGNSIPDTEDGLPTGRSAHQMHSRVSPDMVTYNTLISGVASTENPQLKVAIAIKNHMESRGLHSNEVTYNALMAVAARSLKPEEAFEIYDEMIARRLKPNCECFTTLITLCGRTKMMERAFKIHDQMIASGIEPSVITFNALLTACRCIDGNEAGDAALRVLEAMRGLKGCVPDVITYSTVIDALGRAGRFREVRNVLERMGSEGIAPNLVTYTSVISALTKSGDLRGALCVLQDMEKRGIKPNVYTFSSLIHGAGRCGEFSKAFEMLEMMRERGIMASRVTYSMLLQLAIKSGKIEHLHYVVEMLAVDKRLKGTKQLTKIEQVSLEIPDAGTARRRRAFHEMNEAMCECVSDAKQRGIDWSERVEE